MRFVRGASDFLGIRCTLLWDSLKLAIPLETENDLLLGSHKRCFFSFEQRANKTVLRERERDLSLKNKS